MLACLLIPVLNCVFLLVYGFFFKNGSGSVAVLNWIRFSKVYLLYWIIILLAICSRPFYITLSQHLEFYIVDYVNVSASGFSLFILSIIVFVSNSVLINSIDYLGTIDNVLFLIIICLFQFSMITFILTSEIIINFINWDLLGIISYLLINYWVFKVNSGIKAIVYNKVGDIFFVLWFSLVLDFFSSVLLIRHLFIYLNSISLLYLLSILLILFSKSAQLPFTSWLLNAMSAPTPISALLHSSTMVIAGVWLGLIIYDYILLLLDICFFFSLLFLGSVMITLLFSLWSACCVSDVKSIIAFSTVSQISYMFLALVINPILCLFISLFMLYIRVYYFYYQDHSFIINPTINQSLEWKLITFLLKPPFYSCYVFLCYH